MDKKRLEIIIISVFILIFIFALANSIKIVKKKGAARPAPFTAASSSDKIKPLSLPAESGKKLREESLEWVRDPFSGKTYKGTTLEGTGDLMLVGILWSRQKPTAIINNKICEIGTRINGYLVVNIQEDRVILNDGSKDLELRVGQ